MRSDMINPVLARVLRKSTFRWIMRFSRPTPGAFEGLARESLTIAGWVAMWRPMEIYLYDWWPLRRRGKLFEKLSRIQVEVRKRE